MTARVCLLTSDDLVGQLLDQSGGGAVDGLLQRKARRALQQGLLEVNAHRLWNYSRRQVVLNTNDQYSTGTISFDLTGGSSERLVTLSSGTWPSWAGQGWLLIDNKTYRVNQRLTGTTLTLAENSAPGADIAAGETYTLFEPSYRLPYDCASILTCWDMTSRVRLAGIAPVDYDERWGNQYEAGTPDYFSVFGDPWISGALRIGFYPVPADGRQIAYTYDRTQQPLRVWKYNTGTVTISASSTALTGNSTVFTSNMVGCVIRFGTTTTEPTNLEGSSPYAEERVITAVTNGTTATLDEAVDSAYTAVKYYISDLVDVEPTAMRTAVVNCSAVHFARERNADSAELSRRTTAYVDALRLAMQADRRFAIEDSGVGYQASGFPIAHTPTNAGYSA